MQKIVKNNKVNKEKDIVKKQTGITLIALVITIIVLLILAGVSIATLTGNNGILTQANQAKENNNSAAAKEKVQVEALGSIDKDGKFNEGTFKENVKNNIKGSRISESGNSLIVTVDGYDVPVDKGSGEVGEPSKGDGTTPPSASVQPGTVVSKTEKNNYVDNNGDTATVPAGFTVSKIEEEQNIANGLVIYDIPEKEISSVNWTTKNDDGAYNVQTLYNQFVWIPVANETVYQRNFTYPSYYSSYMDITPDNSTFTDTGYLPTDIQPTTDDATNNETAERTAVLKYNGFYIARYEAGKDGSNVISKQNVTVYTDKTQEEFKSIGKTMYGDSSQYVKSAMCSGIQWDMVMQFVDGKTDGNENTYDVRTYTSIRHTGSETEAGKNTADKVQNIYDLEGNCVEYVAEKNNTSKPFTNRGGDYSYGSRSYRTASHRVSDLGSGYSTYTFRPALYVE